MRNLFTYFRGLIPLIALFFLLPSALYGTDVTFDFTTDAGYAVMGLNNGKKVSSSTPLPKSPNACISVDGVSIVVSGTGNAPALTKDAYFRLYKNTSITFSVTGTKKIKSITGVFISYRALTAPSGQGGNYSDDSSANTFSWSGSESSVTLNNATSGSADFSKWVVTYSEDTNPSISASDKSVSYEAQSGVSFSYTISNTVEGGKVSVSKVSGDFISNVALGDNNTVTFDVAANDDPANSRNGVIRLTYTYAGGSITKDVTITQGKYVQDYVTLPYTMTEGATSFKDVDGVTSSGTSTYSDDAKYNLRFDTEGDFVNVKTDSPIGGVSIDYKMTGGNSTSKFIIKESTDGEEWSTVEELTISGSQSSTGTVATTSTFNSKSRYVQLYFNKGSNVGVKTFTVSRPSTSWRVLYKYNDKVTTDAYDDVPFADCAAYVLKVAPVSPSEYITFSGWSDGATIYEAGANYEPTDNVTFNAVWEFTNQATAYTKATAATMIIGGTYVWQAQKSDNTNYVATAMGKNTYLGATVLGTYSSLSGNTLTLTSETPQSFIFSLAEAGWLIEDAANTGNYLREIGENKLEWNAEKSIWTMSGAGSEEPSFANKYGDADYTMYANLGSTRFNAYTSKGTNADAVLYHLASESAHTLSLVIDGETTNTYTIKDGYSWVLPTPKKYGFIFQGWATEAGGTVEYADGASYTMPAEAKSLYAVWEAQTIRPSFTVDLNDAEPYQHMKGNSTVVKLTIEADHADTYQWYEAVSATSYEGATLLTGEEGESYTCSNTEIGTKYFFCTLTNAVGSVNSKIATVNTIGSDLCKLSHIEFSNGFDAFIKDNKITAYYMAGTTAPTVVESSIKISDNATKAIDGNTLIVTAEDGTTQTSYTIVLSEVTLLTVSTNGEATFDGNEAWVKTGYDWDATKGWKFSRNMNGEDDSRMVDGRNRLYFFVGPAKTFVLNNTGVTSDRKIKVYVNGEEQTSVNQINKNSADVHAITIPGLKDNDNNMVAIVSDQNGGDGGFTKYTYTANPQHHIIYNVNGAVAKEEDVYEGYALTFPADPADIEGKKFQGWIEGDAIVGVQETAPSFVNTTNLKATKTTTYHAVFAEEVETTFDASDITNTPAVVGENLSWANPNTGVKLHLSAGSRYTSGTPNTFSVSNGTTNYFQITSNANITKIVTTITSTDYKINSVSTGASLSTSSTTQTITATSSSLKDVKAYATSNKQIRATEIVVHSITDYCTSPLPQVSMTVSATELAEYVGNTNSTITLSGMQSDYAGTITVASNKEEVATAELDGNTIKIKGISAGKARITVTAPATAKYSKKIAYIDVTISEKLAHGLSFGAATLNLIVGATEIVEPTLSNLNNLPVVYSLVYATPANEGTVATIDPATGKITLADPSLSTETQGAVTVKASTVGDYSHVAGEVTYNLVVARKVTTTSWSNGGAAVNIDQDDMATLPTASNDGGLAITYTSSNENAAKFVDGVLTFVDYGTTTITAATEANEEYAATSASYVLTFAPRYTVTFKVNGVEFEMRETAVGAGVTPPSVAAPAGYSFIGWVNDAIDGEVTTAQTLVALVDGKYMPENEDPLYAVFMRGEVAPDAVESTVTLSYSSSVSYSSSFTTKKWGDYNFKVKQVGCFDNSSMQFHSADGVIYNDDEFNAAIKKVVVTYKSGSTKAIAVKLGSSANPTTQAITPTNSGDVYTFDCSAYTYTYLKIYNTSGTNNVNSIVITLDKPQTYYYRTSFDSESITLTNPTEGDYGFSTFCGSANYTVEGAVAYKASVVSGELVLTKLEGIIPAGNSDYENGVVIAGTPGETATIRYTSEEATADMSGNQLLGTLAITPTETLKNGAEYLMVFSKSNGGFVSYTGANVPAYKACLPYNSPVPVDGAPMRMVFGRDNLPTNNVNVNVNNNQGTKVMIDGRLYILRDGKTYDSFGRLVK